MLFTHSRDVVGGKVPTRANLLFLVIPGEHTRRMVSVSQRKSYFEQ